MPVVKATGYGDGQFILSSADLFQIHEEAQETEA